VKGIEPSA